MEKLKKFTIIIFLFAFVFQGCSVLLPQEETLENYVQRYYSTHANLFCDIIVDIHETLEPKTDAIYRIRYQQDGTLQMTKLTTSGAHITSTINNDTISQLFKDGVVDMIDIDGDTILFFVDTIDHSRGIAYCGDGNPSSIRFYNDEMVFIERGNGYFGTLPDTDNTFYYSGIAEKTYYFEVHY